MRVLHVNAGKLYGGVETMLLTLARCRELCPAMEPEFAVCVEGRFSQELRTAGVPVHVVGDVRASRPWTVQTARKNLRDVVRERRIDAVICHMSWAQGVFGPAVRETRTPLVLWIHGGPGPAWLERWARMAPPDLVIFNSNYVEGLYSQWAVVPHDVIYCPVPQPVARPDARAEIRRSLGASGDDVVILQASRMEAGKGHQILLNALAQLDQSLTWQCWFAGEAQTNDQEAYLRSLIGSAEALGISANVRFLGHRSDIPDLMSASDVFCQPNDGREAFGIVFIEALWSGLPVVATGIGGGREILEGSYGLLTKPGDADALSRVLTNLLQSPELREQFGAAGPARAYSLCDPRRQLTTLHQAMQSVVERGLGASCYVA